MSSGNGHNGNGWMPAASAFAQPPVTATVRSGPTDLAGFIRWLGLPASSRQVLQAAEPNGLRPFNRLWSDEDMGALVLASEDVSAFVALSIFFTDSVQTWLEAYAPDVNIWTPQPDSIVEGLWRFATVGGDADDAEAQRRVAGEVARLLTVIRDLANDTRTHPADIVGMMVALPVLNPSVADPRRVHQPASVQSVLGLQRTAVPALGSTEARRILGAIHACSSTLRRSHWPVLVDVATAVSQVMEDIWRGPVSLGPLEPWGPGEDDPGPVKAVEIVSLVFEMVTDVDADGSPREVQKVLHDSGSLAVDQLSGSPDERAGGLLETPAGRLWLCEKPGGGLFLAADRPPTRDMFRAGTASPVDAAIHGVDVNYPLVGFTY